MLRALPYFLVVGVGMWASVLVAKFVPVSAISAAIAALGLVNSGYSYLAQRIDAKLGELDRIVLSDQRIQARLTDRIRARRRRLNAKRVMVFFSGIVAAIAAYVSTAAHDFTIASASLMVAISALLVGSTGSVLMFFESSQLDERTSEIVRFSVRLKASKEEAARLKAAKREPATAVKSK